MSKGRSRRGGRRDCMGGEKCMKENEGRRNGRGRNGGRESMEEGKEGKNIGEKYVWRVEGGGLLYGRRTRV